MIVEIEAPKSSCVSALDYNEQKVAHEVAELVAFCNLPGTDRDDIYETFARYEKTRYPVREMSFHASVNPSELDSCTEDQILEFIGDLMEHLGYKDQPVLVYRHHDIERQHYHVVSVRADADGRKINNLYEKRKASAFMRRVASKYGFSMVEKGDRVRSSEDLSEDVHSNRIVRFSQKGDKMESLREVYSAAIAYDFDGIAQLQCVLEGLGVEATVNSSAQEPVLSLRGLDDKGRPLTEPFSEQEIGLPLYEMCVMASLPNKSTHRKRFREKERLKGVVRSAFKYSKSEQHFVNILRNKGVSVHFHRTDRGEIFGVTFTDHTTRSVFKASEIPDAISISMMRKAVESGLWRREERGSARERYMEHTHNTRDVAVDVSTNLKAGVIARKEVAIGQPSGNAVRKKNRKAKEVRQQEFEDGQYGSMKFSFEDDRFDDKLV